MSAAVAAAGAVDMQIENALNKSQGRKRCHGTMSAPQIRVTVLGTESEPAPQQIIAESDRALPIHEIACHSKQVMNSL
ncbi:unnamed protein product [Gongylonema pulchrum]|uniref:Uncharacterized protein n=1 Tax=Gongylonema pulchrum TaxID=637853 RepID=A0A3P6T6G7_9BILA|nr:unnamed protein product [Gongylonema pulchrum]